MEIHQQTIALKKGIFPRSIAWLNDSVIDWANGGNVYALDREMKQSTRMYAYRFDAAIASEDGVYAVIYEEK